MEIGEEGNLCPQDIFSVSCNMSIDPHHVTGIGRNCHCLADVLPLCSKNAGICCCQLAVTGNKRGTFKSPVEVLDKGAIG